MPVIEMIEKILRDDSFDDRNCEHTKCEIIENLIPEYGWDIVQETLFLILSDPNRKFDDYLIAAQVFWGASLDKRRICIDKTIALLYNRLSSSEDESISNLIWSIVCKLKKLDYLNFDYDPLSDPDVIKEMPT